MERRECPLLLYFMMANCLLHLARLNLKIKNLKFKVCYGTESYIFFFGSPIRCSIFRHRKGSKRPTSKFSQHGLKLDLLNGRSLKIRPHREQSNRAHLIKPKSLHWRNYAVLGFPNPPFSPSPLVREPEHESRSSTCEDDLEAYGQDTRLEERSYESSPQRSF